MFLSDQRQGRSHSIHFEHKMDYIKATTRLLGADELLIDAEHVLRLFATALRSSEDVAVGESVDLCLYCGFARDVRH